MHLHDRAGTLASVYIYIYIYIHIYIIIYTLLSYYYCSDILAVIGVGSKSLLGGAQLFCCFTISILLTY